LSEHSEAPFLSVVIPTFNEVGRLPRTLEEIGPYLKRRFPVHEIIIVDDNSPDGTSSLCRGLQSTYPNLTVFTQPGRIGKGAAVRRGCLAAKGDCILFMDADHATPIDEVEKMLPMLGKRDVVVGVRTYQDDESHSRRIVGLCAQLLAHLIVFRKPVIDSQCGFKLFSRRSARMIFPYCRVNGGMLDVELFYLIHMFDIKCYYQPVHWNNKADSKVSVLRSVFVDTYDMLKIRMVDAAGKYAKPLEATEQPWYRGDAVTC
jgi:dolichyl-phosphate beta-glucosyltransferase